MDDFIIAKKLQYYKNERKKLDAYKTKAALISFRKNLIERQKLINYQNEYDRIRSMLTQTVLKDMPHLKDRKAKLEALGAQAINSIQ